MADEPTETLGLGSLQEFEDKAIDAPAELEALESRLRCVRQRSALRRWLFTGGFVMALVLAGLLLGAVAAAWLFDRPVWK